MKALIGNNKKQLLFLFLCVNVVFIILYHKVLFGGYTYIYDDIGADTISQYFPYYVFDGEQFRNGDMMNYSLQMGLGGSVFQRIVALINPFDFILLLCNNYTMYIGIIVSHYIKIVVIAFIAYMFFSQLYNNEMVNIICSLLWTFCSYITLWGQHYSFSTVMAYFTIFMFALHMYLKRSSVFDVWLPVIVFFTSLQSYYFMYMIGIFSVMYSLVYAIICKIEIKHIIKKIVGLALMAVLGMMMAAFLLSVSIGSFFASERDDAGAGNLWGLLFHFRDENYFFTVLGRLLSNNTLGAGNLYCGWANYYEAPMLFVSNMFLLSFVYSLLNKGGIKRAVLYIVGVFFLFSSLFSVVMTGFSGEYLRWTFIICFSMVISVGFMLENVLEHKYKNKGTAIWLSIIMYGLIYYYLYNTNRNAISLKVIAYSAIFVILYSIWLCVLKDNNKERMSKILLIVVLFEVVICNYNTINARDLISVEESKIYVSDNTVELVEYMKNMDDGLYRARKLYGTKGLNDGLAQGFNSLSWYESVAPESVMSFVDDNSIPPMLYRTCIDIPPDRYNLITLLGTRYIFAYESQQMDVEKYEAIYSYEDKVLYKNKNALNFGYLYFSQVHYSDILEYTVEQRDSILTRYFYLSDNKEKCELVKTIENIDYNVDTTDDLKMLQQNGITDVKLNDNRLEGIIKNDSEETAMLAIPIFIEENWEAYIDGEKTKTYDINGGLIGICVKPGIHEIELRYTNNMQIIGSIISIGATLLYVVMIYIMDRKKRRRND